MMLYYLDHRIQRNMDGEDPLNGNAVDTADITGIARQLPEKVRLSATTNLGFINAQSGSANMSFLIFTVFQTLEETETRLHQISEVKATPLIILPLFIRSSHIPHIVRGVDTEAHSMVT